MTPYKKPVMSNITQAVLFIFIGSIGTAILLLLNVPSGVVISIILTASLALFTIYPMYLIYKSNSLVAIDKYVIRNRKKTLFRYAYALAYGNTQEIEEALELILKKYRQNEMQIIYSANLALHRKDIGRLIQHANQMTKPDLQQYYLGIAYSLNGEEDSANRCLANITTPWMIHSLQASIALLREDIETFQAEANQAVNSATGLQKYTIMHMLNRKLT